MVRKLTWSVALTTCLGVALAGVPAKLALARGGHGGGHHGGGHHASHHGGHHGGHHPYHPSSHHHSHHSHSHHHTGHHDHHHDHHHYNHHHHSWHHGGWGWGLAGLGLGYGLGWGWNNWGWGGSGDTYINNSYPVSTDANSTADSTNANANNQQPAADGQNNNQPNANDRFPVDVWPELGVTTYSGQYGKLQGVVIVTVQPGSAASKSGLVPGDVIQKLNGQPVANTDDLEKILDTAKGEFTAQVWDARTGRTSTLSGQLDQNTEQPAAQGEQAKD